HLLGTMLQLGFPVQKAVQLCRAGIESSERFHRLQAVDILCELAEKYSVEGIDFGELLKNDYVLVRVYAAKELWLKKRNATELVPVLVDALDRSKYQEYHYSDIQSTALEVLGMIGPQATGAAKTLELLKTDPDPVVAKAATETLRRIQP